MTKHVGLGDQIFGIFRGFISVWNFLSIKFMQMLLVTLVAAFAIREIVTSHAIKTVFTSIYRFLTAVTHKPSFKVINRLLLLNFLAYIFLDRFSDFPFILLPKLIIIFFWISRFRALRLFFIL